MKLRMTILAIAGTAASALSGCGDGGGGSVSAVVSPPSSSTQALDTAQVMAQARLTSETGEPYPVNDGALVLTDTSETAEPLSIDGT
jgi:hypothetical protein